MTQLDTIKDQLRAEANKSPCACGKMDQADVSPIGDEQWLVDDKFNKKTVGFEAAVKLRQLTKCNVCGHVAPKHGIILCDRVLLEDKNHE